MKVNLQQTEKILNENHSFSQFSFAMMVTRLKNAYVKSPSPATAQECMSQINIFLEKYHSIMGEDYEFITNF